MSTFKSHEIRSFENTVVPAFMVSLFMTTVLMIAYTPRFDGNDDSAILSMVSGVKRSADPHTVYQNIVLGKFYVFLYDHAPQIAWYTLFQLLLLVMASTAVTWVIIRRLGIRSGIPIAAGICLVFGHGSIAILQYTRTAGITTAAGIFLLFQILEERRTRERETRGSTIGAGLILVGSWLRFQQAGAECLILIGVAADALFLSDCGPFVERKKCRRQIWLTLSIVGIAILGSQSIDHLSYRSQQWQDYLRFNQARTQLLDYGLPDPTLYAQVYQDAGMTDMDLQMFQSWNFADPNRFTAEKLEKLVRAKEVCPDHAHDFLAQTLPSLLRQPEAWWAIVMFLLMLGTRCVKRKLRVKEMVAPVPAILIFAGIQYGLTIVGRVRIPRVDIGLWFAVCLSIIWAFPRENGSHGTALIVYLGIGVSVLTMIFLESTYGATEGTVTAVPRFSKQAEDLLISRKHAEEELTKISRDKAHLYVTKVGALTVYRAYGPFDPIPQGLMDNIIYLGGWAAFTPGWTEVLEAYGAENAFSDLINNDRLRLVDRNAEQTVEYLRTYYDPGTYVQEVGSTGEYGIYRVRTGGEE